MIKERITKKYSVYSPTINWGDVLLQKAVQSFQNLFVNSIRKGQITSIFRNFGGVSSTIPSLLSDENPSLSLLDNNTSALISNSSKYTPSVFRHQHQQLKLHRKDSPFLISCYTVTRKQQLTIYTDKQLQKYS
jgi:hypothetical protein